MALHKLSISLTLGLHQGAGQAAPPWMEAVAALAEAIYGAGKEYEIFLYLTVGTGISCCLVMHKRPYAGAHGDALICASSPLTSTCDECGASNRVALEDYASGPALARRYQSYSPEKISRAQLYKEWRANRGPRFCLVGSFRRISAEARA